jgi:hypothetical protein
MARRLQLHEKFCEILGTRNVYFQPPASVKLNYNCIVYKVSNRNDLRADNKRYRNLIAYEVKLIYRDPDSELPEILMNSFDYIMHNNTFVVDNLHHDVFTIYY